MEQTLKDKKEFVRWFLKRYQMKRRECVWILNYLLSHEELLKKVHFVEEAHYCPRALVMSVTESTGVPFRFYKGKLMTADAEKSFHDLRLHPDEDMYIQLNFPNVPVSMEYLAVLEENTFMPKEINTVNKEDAEIAEQLIEHVMKTFQLNHFNKMINKALDNGDKELFLKLTSQMLEKSYKSKGK